MWLLELWILIFRSYFSRVLPPLSAVGITETVLWQCSHTDTQLDWQHCIVHYLGVMILNIYGEIVWTMPSLHSKKFKMNEEVDSFLSEKVSNLLLTWKVNSITVDNKSGGFSEWTPTPNYISGQETLRSNFKIESPSSTGIPVLRMYVGNQYLFLIFHAHAIIIHVIKKLWSANL